MFFKWIQPNLIYTTNNANNVFFFIFLFNHSPRMKVSTCSCPYPTRKLNTSFVAITLVRLFGPFCWNATTKFLKYRSKINYFFRKVLPVRVLMSKFFFFLVMILLLSLLIGRLFSNLSFNFTRSFVLLSLFIHQWIYYKVSYFRKTNI